MYAHAVTLGTASMFFTYDKGTKGCKFAPILTQRIALHGGRTVMTRHLIMAIMHVHTGKFEERCYEIDTHEI